ncbi:hypothetical protein BPAE_0130g00010 [Botrytis paeoniae]|uniref:Uncharacterized protein n=1 Tax=Botrytis paeoniae TaxID=278948 RepID=A0A4Z1FLJ8_9HELO|nr:hypothetical protein BPAE_0130g00010 [Botrytis paeoniae]
MHFSTLVTLTLSVFSARAIADNCFKGYKYCGTDLLSVGNYHDNIVQALKSADLPYDDKHIYHTLFPCVEDGLLGKPVYCEKGCALAASGSHLDDYCR